jgi:peptidyl-Lys metalloendopeptidase
VRSHFSNIRGALVNDSVTLTFNCACAPEYADDYAYVFPNAPYEIFLCGAFWNAPMTGTDSKSGTLVHELSHFNVVAGTDDHAYGQTAARQLADGNPALAIDNADSHEYFAENTPAESMAAARCGRPCPTARSSWAPPSSGATTFAPATRSARWPTSTATAATT